MKMVSARILFVACWSAAILIGEASTAQAQTSALEFTGGYPLPFTGSGVAGWSFDVVSSAIEVTELGIWDEGADGLLEEHRVGLWTTDGTLITSLNITNDNSIAAPSTSSDGCWLFSTIAPVTFTSGSYVIGMQALNDSPDYFRIATTATTIPEIVYGGTVQVIETTNFDFPGTQEPLANDGGFGPNFRVASSAIPESSTILLLGLTLPICGAVAAVARRRKK